MALYAIGDLHLSLSCDKPMDVFGGRWDNYMDKLSDGLSVLTPEDTLVICGDVSWGMSLEEALSDFRYIDAFPGKKIILKGNHDYWWNTVSKMDRFFADNSISSIQILNNNAFLYNDIAICGTRGWFYDPTGTQKTEHDKKIILREAQRLEFSLKAAPVEKEKIAFLHYPPRYAQTVSEEIVAVLNKYEVKRCYYGHIHGYGHKHAVVNEAAGIVYRMVSADYINFTPEKILD